MVDLFALNAEISDEMMVTDLELTAVKDGSINVSVRLSFVSSLFSRFTN